MSFACPAAVHLHSESSKVHKPRHRCSACRQHNDRQNCIIIIWRTDYRCNHLIFHFCLAWSGWVWSGDETGCSLDYVVELSDSKSKSGQLGWSEVSTRFLYLETTSGNALKAFLSSKSYWTLSCHRVDSASTAKCIFAIAFERSTFSEVHNKCHPKGNLLLLCKQRM